MAAPFSKKKSLSLHLLPEIEAVVKTMAANQLSEAPGISLRHAGSTAEVRIQPWGTDLTWDITWEDFPHLRLRPEHTLPWQANAQDLPVLQQWWGAVERWQQWLDPTAPSSGRDTYSMSSHLLFALYRTIIGKTIVEKNYDSAATGLTQWEHTLSQLGHGEHRIWLQNFGNEGYRTLQELVWLHQSEYPSVHLHSRGILKLTAPWVSHYRHVHTNVLGFKTSTWFSPMHGLQDLAWEIGARGVISSVLPYQPVYQEEISQALRWAVQPAYYLDFVSRASLALHEQLRQPDYAHAQYDEGTLSLQDGRTRTPDISPYDTTPQWIGRLSDWWGHALTLPLPPPAEQAIVRMMHAAQTVQCVMPSPVTAEQTIEWRRCMASCLQSQEHTLVFSQDLVDFSL